MSQVVTLDVAEIRHLERQLTYARPIYLLLAVVDLFELEPRGLDRYAFLFVTVYFLLATFLAALEAWRRSGEFALPLWVDLTALGVFLVLTPAVVPFWFLYLYVSYSAAVRWDLRRAVVLAGAATLALLLREALRDAMTWAHVASWVPLVAGTFAAGVGIALLGNRQRQHALEYEFLSRLAGKLQVERGLAESVRLLLDKLARTFYCQEAVLVFRDMELERIFVWCVRPGVTSHLAPVSFPLTRSDAFLLEVPEITLCWNSLEGPGDGFAWNRRDGKRLAEVPRLPGPSREEHHVRSLAAASFDFNGRPVGRFLLYNRNGRFSPADLRWFERIVRYISAPLENVFLLRYMRARAIEAERARISRDLHDGILQTLLSVGIQLDVLRRKAGTDQDRLAAELGGLEQTVKRESEELRRLVTGLRPVHVQSTDLLDVMRGFAETFQSETGLGVDLLADSANLSLPDKVCRELFQIYREALHNIKKHSRASHVVVKLWQEEAKVVLVVDDNGQGFSFAGRFTSDELDRLRLGPISIKERTRSLEGILTVESNPGHGARITIEVPLS